MIKMVRSELKLELNFKNEKKTVRDKRTES